MDYKNSFEITSGAARITDPCYSKDTWCSGVITNVQTGTWLCEVLMQDDRVSRLFASVKDDNSSVVYKTAEFEVGVDSGQAGIFDESLFPDKAEDDEAHDAFYDKVCAITLAPDGFGVVPFGCVSSTGWGDGSYVCTFGTSTESGKVTRIQIDYMLDEEEDDN